MKIWLSLFMGFFLAAGVVRADIVHLKNGTSVEGKVVEETSDNVKIDIGGVALTYYMDEVASVERTPEAPVAAPAIAVAESASDPVAVRPAIDPDKEVLIRQFVAIYGVKENMQANFDQMTNSLKPEQAEAFRNSIKVDDIIEQLLPIYDRHFTANDLRAYINFYGSDEGKKLVQSLPLLMKDSVDVSMKYLDAHLPDSLKQQPEPVSGR